jgi:hypothetical protein
MPVEKATFLRTKVDSALRSAFEMVYGVDFLDPSGSWLGPNNSPDPTFTRDLFDLKIGQGGGGFRPHTERTNFSNCLNNALPQMLSCKAANGTTVRPGLWTSLSNWIGEGFFDGAQHKRWEKFSPTLAAASLASSSRSSTALSVDTLTFQSL